MGAAAGAAALQFTGGAIGAAGELQAGNAARKRGDYQAAVLRNNAALSRNAAADALSRGRTAVGRKQTQIGQFQGRQRTALAASGVLVDEGSAAELLADTAFVGQQEIQDIQRNAEREALADEINALNFEADATLAQMAGSQAQQASRFGAAATLLTGGGRAGSTLFASK